MNHFWDKILFEIGGFALTPAKIAGLVIIFSVAWILLFFLRRILLSNYHLSPAEKGTRTSLYQLVKYFLYVLAFSVSISFLGFDITF